LPSPDSGHPPVFTPSPPPGDGPRRSSRTVKPPGEWWKVSHPYANDTQARKRQNCRDGPSGAGAAATLADIESAASMPVRMQRECSRSRLRLLAS
jgi:hypothetical protein